MQDYVKVVNCWCAWKVLKFICALNFIYARLRCIISYIGLGCVSFIECKVVVGSYTVWPKIFQDFVWH